MSVEQRVNLTAYNALVAKENQLELTSSKPQKRARKTAPKIASTTRTNVHRRTSIKQSSRSSSSGNNGSNKSSRSTSPISSSSNSSSHSSSLSSLSFSSLKKSSKGSNNSTNNALISSISTKSDDATVLFPNDNLAKAREDDEEEEEEDEHKQLNTPPPPFQPQQRTKKHAAAAAAAAAVAAKVEISTTLEETATTTTHEPPLVLVSYDSTQDEVWKKKFKESLGVEIRNNTLKYMEVDSHRTKTMYLSKYKTALVRVGMISTLVSIGLAVTAISVLSKMPTYTLYYQIWRRTFGSTFRSSKGSFGSFSIGWFLLFGNLASALRYGIECGIKQAFLEELEQKQTRLLQWIDFAISWPLLFGAVAIHIGLIDLTAWIFFVLYMVTIVVINGLSERAKTFQDRRLVARGNIVPYVALWVYLGVTFYFASQNNTAPLWVLLLFVATALLSNSIMSLLAYQITPPVYGKQIGPFVLSPFRALRLMTDDLDTDVERYMRAAVYIDVVYLVTRVLITGMMIANLVG